MLRIVLTYVLPLALPTIMYLIWTAWVTKKVRDNRAKAKAEGTEGDHTEPEDYDIKTPWFRLILAGVGLLVVSLLISVFFSPKNPEDSVYQPPHMEGDTIVPGQFVPADKAKPQN
ncbi:hypothetical protein V5T82_13220 [Magnetovibrio sp. PR-2]|uniref:hypothetical protein n=1 Tax=Magnetovibrio sp. PR-2 TaxID=3120356 RepID=UPI002FCE414E